MCVKTKINTPLHVCSTEQRCDKTRDLSPFVRGKRRLCIKKVPWQKLFNVFSINRKLPANGGLLLRFHNSVAVGRGLHALQPLAQMAVSARAFSYRLPTCVFAIQLSFVWFSARILTL